MLIAPTPAAIGRLSASWRRKGLTVGLVPTMGALHAGHLALVRASRTRCDRTIVSIFVNPMQFGPREDLARYPRPVARDRRLLKGAGVDALYAPSPAAMYPRGFATAVEVGSRLTGGLCGRFRPGHFRGVATVVAKLFNAVNPDEAFFGMKDAQQVAVIRRMTRDLDLGVRIRAVPTVREPDGLALSSRNAYLDPSHRLTAPVLRRALLAGRGAAMGRGATSASVRAKVRRVLAGKRAVKVQYVELVDADELTPLACPKGKVLLAAAVFLGRTRLIDNVVFRVPRGRR
jgi:pantoate--beta-alanine ligase